MANRDLPVGMFDSGIGGLTVLKSCLEVLPSENFLYLGDTARTPYGPKGSDTIRRYGRECAEFLVQKGIKALVVACNTVSSYALQEIEQMAGCPVIGTVDPAVRSAIEATRLGKIGVIGTAATISGGAYERALHAADSSLEVRSKACPLFVPVVEEGLREGAIVDGVVAHYLDEFAESGIDTLILGCTHYPLIQEAIQKYLGDQVTLVACSEAIASDLKSIVEPSKKGTGELDCFVTDATERFDSLSSAFLTREGIHATKISL
ncbi:MAG TPA: glutamate racemase [Fimbriimonas sp.]|nr:glutamate racemase [Fimbriimonas sp.]